MFQVQFITHFNDKITYLDSVHIALEGGCRWIQLRMKDATDEEFMRIAVPALAICREHNATFIVDDRVAIARKIKADGVHLGKNDMPVDEARALLGTDFIIGGTANTFEDVQSLHRKGADYIGCGPFRYTTTKKKLAPILGADGYANIIRRMREAGINLPIVGIGGVKAEDIPLLARTGLTGIALSSSVLTAQCPINEMKRVIKLAEQYNDQHTCKQ